MHFPSGATAQLTLRCSLAVSAALRYREAGFTIVYQDIVVGEYLLWIVAALHASPLYIIVLCPDAKVVAVRAASREKVGYTADLTPAMFDRALRQETPRLGLWLDSSQLELDETVDEILARLEEARIR